MASGVGVVGVHDDVAELGKSRAREFAGDRRGQLGQYLMERLEVIDSAEVVGDEERLRLRLAEDVPELVRLVARVERDDDGAETRARVLGEEPLGPVREPNRDVLAVADAEGGEAPGEPVPALAELGARDAHLAGHHRLPRPIPWADGVAPGG